MTPNHIVFAIALCLTLSVSWAEEAENAADSGELDRALQTIKHETTVLEARLRELEREITVPATRRLAAYVLSSTDDYRIREIRLSVNGNEVARKRYEAQESEALATGGADHLIDAEVPTGLTRAEATVTLARDGVGIGRSSRELTQTLEFRKDWRSQTLVIDIDRGRWFGSTLNMEVLGE